MGSYQETKAIDFSQESSSSSTNLLLKMQKAGKTWEGKDVPEELEELRQLLVEADCDMSWSPKKLGVHLLTPTKFRGMVLKQVLMKLYPFETFWMTDSLEETLQKCLLVGQQLGLEPDRSLIWGQCSVDRSFEFWKRVLKSLRHLIRSARKKEDVFHEAKASVVAALMASRGTDWDKQIARNFNEGLGRNKLPIFIRNCEGGGAPATEGKSRFKPTHRPHGNWRNTFPRVFDENQDRSVNTETNKNAGNNATYSLPNAPLTTTSFAMKLKQESEDMIEALRNIEKYYSSDCVLQIELAFELGNKVCELADEFEGYMATNNRGAFRDIEALTNHTDKVLRAMSRITMTYQDFFLEFQKYFGSGRGDEININLPLFPLHTDIMENH